MNGMLRALGGVLVDVPVSLLQDFATLGGAVNERENTYTGDAMRRIRRNIDDDLRPETDRERRR